MKQAVHRTGAAVGRRGLLQVISGRRTAQDVEIGDCRAISEGGSEGAPSWVVFTPSRAELAKARKTVAAFERARAAGKDRAKVGGALIEVPTYAAAKRLLASVGRS